MSNASITHKLELDNGAAIILKEFLTRPEWYKGEKFKVGLYANDVAERLSELAEPKAKDEDIIGGQRYRPEFVERLREWNRENYVVEVSEPERESMKKCIKFFWEHGALPNSRHVAKIGRALGLDQD